MKEDARFIEEVLAFIKEKDPLHYKKTSANVEGMRLKNPQEFSELLRLVFDFFSVHKLTAQEAAVCYLKMIQDMRVEGLYFKKHDAYSCKNQEAAYQNVYSKPAIMSYYMNALLLSQILWAHHFNMLIFFNSMLNNPVFKNIRTVLDVGPGHGFFSYLTLKKLNNLDRIDIVDISESSLKLTKSIIGDGDGKIRYYMKNVFEYRPEETYDLIILGEVLEHLDEPLPILNQLYKLLSPYGHLWITTPTNAPALDHVYLFRNKEQIEELLKKANYKIVDSSGWYSENVGKEMAEKLKISYLYGGLLSH